MTRQAGLVAAFGLVTLISLAAIFFLTAPDQIVTRVAVVSGIAILGFATRVVPEIATSMLCFLAFLALGAAPPDVIFSGFASSGIWLMISGLIIGAAITQTGLGDQIAARIYARTGTSYSRAIVLLAISGVGLGLLVPSTIPRVIVLMPVAVSLAAAMGYASGSRGQIGLVAIAATSTLLPTYAILTANLPTIVHYGALETLYGIQPSYAHYFIAQAPVNLVRFGLLLASLIAFARTDPSSTSAATTSKKPMTTPQKWLLALLCLAIGFWATDQLHHISPAWIALTVASVVLLPVTGFLKKDAMKTSIDMSPIFFLAAVFAISAVAHHVGLDALVAGDLIPRLGLSDDNGLHNLYAITGFSVLISHLTTAPAAPVLLAPLASAMAEAANWPVLTVAMAQIIGISTPLLPYQAPPFVVAMALAHIPVSTLTRLCLILAAGVAFIGLPLTYLWWQMIGLL